MFSVTYEIVTPESAENGEAEQIGFVCENVDLRSALRQVSPSYDCGRWFDESDGATDYRTGAVERRSLHPPKNITPASYARLKRFLNVR